MPSPNEGESREHFLERCVPQVIDDGAADNTDQAVAICNQMWRDEGKSMNQKLIEAIRERGEGGAIATADWYVKRAIEECGEGLLKSTFGVNAKSLLEKSKNQLVYSGPGIQTVKQTTSVSEFRELLPEGVEIPKHTALLDFHTVTTPSEDRDKDVLKTEGAQVDPDLPTLWQHMQTMPLGKMLAVVEHSSSALKLVSALLDVNEFTADAIKFTEAGVLRWSHGFIAIEWEERKDASGDKGFLVTGWEMLEESKVSVPSNRDARTELITMFSRDKLQSDYWKAVAKHYYDERPAQMPMQMKLRLGDAELDIRPYEEKTDSELPRITAEKPKVKEFVGTTGEADDHTHSVELDDDGNGRTSTDDGHSHEVEGFRVQEADDHTHSLTRGELEERTAGVARKDPDEAVRDSASDAPLTKAGRTLSKRNLEILKNVRDDLEEMSGMDKMPKAAGALCERCMRNLDGVIKAAEPDDEDEKPNEEKPKQFSAREAAELLIISDDDEWLGVVHRYVETQRNIAEENRRAASYRDLVSPQR